MMTAAMLVPLAFPDRNSPHSGSTGSPHSNRLVIPMHHRHLHRQDLPYVRLPHLRPVGLAAQGGWRHSPVRRGRAPMVPISPRQCGLVQSLGPLQRGPWKGGRSGGFAESPRRLFRRSGWSPLARRGVVPYRPSASLGATVTVAWIGTCKSSSASRCVIAPLSASAFCLHCRDVG
jgi:hypothetical protein